MELKKENKLFISNSQENDVFGVTNLRLDRYINNQKIVEQELKLSNVTYRTSKRKLAIYELIIDAISPFFTRIDISLLAYQMRMTKKDLLYKFENMSFSINEARKVNKLLNEQLLNNVNIYKTRARILGKENK